MAKAREPKVFRSMDDLPLMLTPYRRQTKTVIQ